MVTTRSQDRVEESSPAPVNKRRRFSSEGPNDNITVEIPVREIHDVKAQVPPAEVLIEDESDEDAAPEVISSRDAAQQARALPNRAIRHAGNKRRKVTMEPADIATSTAPESILTVIQPNEQIADASESVDQDSAQGAAAITLNEAAAEGAPQITGGESTASEVTTPQNEPTPSATKETEISVQISIPKSDTLSLDDQEIAPAEVPARIAEEVHGDEAPALQQNPEPSIDLAITEAKAATSTDLHLNVSEEVPPDVMEEVEVNIPLHEPLPLAEPNNPAPGVTTMQTNLETAQQTTVDPSMSQSAETDTMLPSSPAEQAATQEQTFATTPPPEDQVLHTPQPITSGLVTPIWQTRTHDTPVGSASFPAAARKTENTNTLPSRPRPKLSLHRAALVTSKPKPTSLQQYRDRLLNRHQRTTTWGPPGFRKTKFVGA